VHDARKASASCLALLGGPPPALDSPPSRRAANAIRRTQRPKAAPRASPPGVLRIDASSSRHAAAAQRRPRSPGWRPPGMRAAPLAAAPHAQGRRGHGWPGGREAGCPGLGELGGVPTQAVGASFWIVKPDRSPGRTTPGNGRPSEVVDHASVRAITKPW
jgi:hypothetical protein